MLKRILTQFLALYVLVLVFAPCVDDDFCVDPNPRPVLASASLPIHQNQHDCCTPFCTCSCCSAPCEVLISGFIPQNFFTQGTLSFFFYSPFRTHYDPSIWEPPKA